MKKFKEKKIVNVLNIISLVLGLCWISSLVIGVFYHLFLFGFLLLPIAVIPILLSDFLSDKNEYTRRFIAYIQNKIDDAETLDELKSIRWEFLELATKDKMYCLSFPVNLRYIHRDLNSKIEILEKQTNKNK